MYNIPAQNLTFLTPKFNLLRQFIYKNYNNSKQHFKIEKLRRQEQIASQYYSKSKQTLKTQKLIIFNQTPPHFPINPNFNNMKHNSFSSKNTLHLNKISRTTNNSFQDNTFMKKPQPFVTNTSIILFQHTPHKILTFITKTNKRGIKI